MKNSRISKKWVIILSAAILLVLAVGIFFIADRKNNQKTVSTPTAAESMNLDPPTEEERAETDSNKDDVIDQQINDQKTPSTGIAAVTPVVSSWGQDNYTKNLSIAGYVPGVFEDGGTCTLTVVGNDQTLSASKTGTKNVSNVSCGYIEINRSELSPGTWTATISYSSATSRGTSGPQTVNVQ